MIVPFSPPDISQTELDYVCDALRSGWITTGPKTKELERRLAEYCGVPRLACLNSATAALELCLHTLGIGPGDEVITCAYTYTATASVVCHVGASLKLVDCQKDSYEFDYDALARAISEKTKVVIPVDLAGRMVDYPRLLSILEEKKRYFRPKAKSRQELFDRVIILADAAHSLGASQAGKMSGSVADFTAFSFHAVKNFTTAEGGALCWKPRAGLDDEELYQDIMRHSLHGQTKDALAKTQVGAWEYDIVAPLYKCNMTDIHAAIGLAQLETYAAKLVRRKELVERYNAAFSEGERFDYLDHFAPLYGQDNLSSAHLYLLRLKQQDISQRNETIVKMAETGISCNVHYKPLPLLSAYKNLGFHMQDYPHAYLRYANEISLPLYSSLSDEACDYVISKLHSIV